MANKAIERIPQHLEIIEQIKRGIWDEDTNNNYLDHIATDLKTIFKAYSNQQRRGN